ncbi:hypothetical protein [Nocardiopsis baichengensis]|uniref:hypothetical protein n=1 Tax=Nocardiopsis baichengensis TaxID=280240 RepID=UPI000374B0D4|nr:hypothetical protein [Nocardiopsis baichengensis]
MPRPRTPNTALAALVSRTGWSYEALARAVNRVGAETGLDLRYDRTSVAHWLTGSRPRPPVPGLIAEAAARRLGRPVALAETGMGGSGRPFGDGALDWRGGTVTALAELGSADMDISRRRMLRGIVYSVAAAAAVPAWEEIADRAERTAAGTGPRVGEGEVEAVATMAEAFSTIDDRFGGGHARSAVAAYIANDLTGWLAAEAVPATRRALHAAAADLVYLAGFMAWDDEAHGLAERYYLQALRLAAEAEDPLTYATVLRGMSIQAGDLGHRTEALHLVQAAASAAGTAAPPRMRAFLLGQEAVAHAAVGDRRSALNSFGRAERHLEAATSKVETFGSYHHASLAYQEAHLRAHLGDLDGAVRAMRTSNRRRPAAERRSRAISTAQLAEIQYRAGHLEAACDSWDAFLDDYPHLAAGRADAAARRIRGAARRHHGNARTRQVAARLSEASALR